MNLRSLLTRLFSRQKPLDTPAPAPERETFNPDLTRKRVEDVTMPVGDWRWQGSRSYAQYRYWCKCGTELTDGPRGGVSVNAVCETCRTNHGCLPGYWGE